MTAAEIIYERVKALPEPLVREVLDFAGFLSERVERASRRDLVDAQTTALAAVWENSEDAVWDDL